MSEKNILVNLREQVAACKELLNVFQEERQNFLSGKMPSTQEIIQTMKRKAQLVDLFEEHRKIMKSIELETETVSPEIREERRMLIRELASILEQLLVIDQENERMLRDMSSSNHSAAKIENTSAGLKPRPALQRQLPLMPFSVRHTAPPASSLSRKPVTVENTVRTASVALAEPVVVRKAEFQRISAAEAIASLLPARPKAHLRGYGKTS